MTDTLNAAPAEAWLNPLAATPGPSLSERLIRGLEAHVADEAHDIAACEELVGRLGDPIARFLLNMIVDDEQRHHAVMRSMIARLREEVDFTVALGHSVIPPVTAGPPVPDAAEIAGTVRGLIHDEREGARHARHLARQEQAGYEGLYPLLLETIARDSEKHATILQFILRRLEHSGVETAGPGRSRKAPPRPEHIPTDAPEVEPVIERWGPIA